MNTAMLLRWGIHIGGCGKLLGALIRVVTLGSAFITSNMRLVFSCNRRNIASSSQGNIGVIGVVIVVGPGRRMVEIFGVVGVVVMVSLGPWVSSSTVVIVWPGHWRSIV